MTPPVATPVATPLENAEWQFRSLLPPAECKAYDAWKKQPHDAVVKERNRRRARQIVDAEERPPIVTPLILTLQERLARPRPKTVWRIEGLQQAGHRVLMAAPAKAGKTTTAINLARSLVDPTAMFLDKFEVQQVDSVTVLDFEMAEDDPGQLDDWYRDADIQHTEKIRIVPLRGRASSFNIMDPATRTKWANQLRGTTYLIWDCISTVIAALNLDENLEAQRLLTAFDELMQEAGIHEALVIQHMGHANERARGSSGFLAWPDVLWTLVRDKKADEEDYSAKRFIKAYGRGVEVPETELLYNAATHRLAMGGGGRKDARAHDALQAVIALLGTSDMSGRQIADAAPGGVSQHDVRRALALGVQRGTLAVTSGPRKAMLYRVASAVGRTAFDLTSREASVETPF